MTVPAPVGTDPAGAGPVGPSPARPVRRLPEDWLRRDLLLTALLCVVSIEMTYLTAFAMPGLLRVDTGWAVLVGVAICLPVVTARRFPIPTGLVMMAMFTGFGIATGFETVGTNIAMFLAMHAIGAWEPNRRRATIARTVIVVIACTWILGEAVRGFYDPTTGERGVNAYFAMLMINVTVNLFYFTAAWVFGNRAWQQALQRQDLEDAAATIEDQRTVIARNAVELERIRIARELHDVITHHVSAMSIQAAAARRLLHRDADRAEQSLLSVESSARSAIEDLRTMVGTLRDPSTNAPSPTLAQLPEIVEDARRAGQKVELRVLDPLTDLQETASTALLRIAQESLTNARKHAGAAARVTVTLRRRSDDAAELDVSDDGFARRSALPGTGTGIQGMRERAEAVGGTLEAGAKETCGFLVRAAVPIRGGTP
ncbi:sensor histidine kinase [Helcobacillus massiliensis]|uniref:histidine kinase n=1 Tax=Helcobacillus massiliensis TaxID=521392 RepID=A0A839QSU8_9MICO|nr:sensor histidine kinase [Helcobacillus massiliensis]MBB3023384.1 signal transduction histidine kinase [Helcobacillus massiliensis]